MKRFIYTLACLVLSVGAWAQNVAKIGTQEYATLAEAVVAVTDGQTITLINDVVLSAECKIGESANVNARKVTIDFGGHTVSSTANKIFTVYDEVTFYNGKIDFSGYGMTSWAISSYGNIIIDGIDIADKKNNAGYIVCARANATVTLKSGTIESNKPRSVVYVAKDGNFVMDGGKLVSNYNTASSSAACVNVAAGGTATINAGELEGAMLALWVDGEANITGGKLTSQHVVWVNKGTANISGGEFYADPEAVYLYTATAKANISGGYFEATGSNKDYLLNIYDSVRDGAQFVVTGGTYKDFNPFDNKAEGAGTNFVDEAYEAVKDANGNYILQKSFAAKIGDTKYVILADAIAAAQNGETVSLLADVTENITVPAGKNITLDLNGKTLSGGSVASNGKKAAILNYGSVVIKDSSVEQTGTVKRDDPENYDQNNSYYVIDNQGTMTIKSGTITNNAGLTTAHKGSSLIRNGEVIEGAVLNIEGGTLTQKNFDVIKNGGKNSVLNITGGTIESENSYAILSYDEVNMSAGTVTGKVCLRSYDSDYAVANISGGTINGNITVETYPGNTPVKHSECNISGTAVINGTLSIGEGNGKTFTANDEKGTIAVSGGTFKNPVPETYCAEGFKPTDDGNGHYGVTEKDYVAQIGENKYASLAEAFATATPGSTVKLLSDVQLSAKLEVTCSDVTLDLNGKTISPADDNTVDNYCIVMVHRGAKLTVDDTSEEKTGCIDGGNGTNAFYGGIQLTQKEDTPTDAVATLVVNNGNIKGKNAAITGNGNRPNTDITINGGNIEGYETTAIYQPQDGKLTINGGTLSGKQTAVEVRAGEIAISGGTFTAAATEFSCNANGNGTTTVGAALAIAQHTTKKDISVTISGGTFTGVKAINESNPQANDPTPQVAMAVTGGKFNGEVTIVDVNNFVSGGTFNNPVPEEYCAGGYIPEDNGDGTYGVKSGSYVAQIDDTKYESLSAAINAATAGQTVKLIADINETVENVNANSVTISLNGKNWTSGSYTLKNDGGTITIEGEGTVKSTGSEGIAVWARTGSIVIEGGNYENCSNEEATVYVGTSDANLAGKQPTITINGGSFKNTADGVYKWNTSLLPLTLNIINNIANADSYQAIVVKGGTFYGNDPSVGDDSQLNKINKNSNFVSSELHAEMKEGVDGVFVIEEGGYVAQVGYIKYLTLDEAADASSTETITLLADATIETIDVVTGKTIDKNEHEITANTFEVIDYEACNIPFDFKANTATYTRNVANNVWGTVCVPFTLKSCDSYTLYKVDGISNDVLEVSEVTDAVVPGTPVIFKAASAAESLTFSTEQANVKLDAPVASDGLIGTYSELTITEGLPSIYFINGDKFHQAQVSLTVPAYRAYIKNTTSGAKPRVLSLFVNEPDVTAIESVSSAATATAIYDASGRKLTTPQKGLNIVKLADGKTVKLLIK